MTNLQKVRKNRNLSQTQLANKAKVNVRTLQYYEQGAKLIDNAKLDTILRLCMVLNCNIEDILEDPSRINKYYNTPE